MEIKLPSRMTPLLPPLSHSSPPLVSSSSSSSSMSETSASSSSVEIEDDKNNCKNIIRHVFVPNQHKSYKNSYTNSFVPASIIVGGTAFVYSSILKHNSCTLSPISTMYMILLALQHCIQPRISKKYLDRRINKKSVALVEEVVKMTMGAGLFSIGAGYVSRGDVDAISTKAKIAEGLKGWSFSSSLAVAALPAALYAVQGILTYTSYQHLDPVTFNGLNQTKMLTAALCCYFLLGTVQSAPQICALAMLLISGLTFQGTASMIWEILLRKKNHCVRTAIGGDSCTVVDNNGPKNYFKLGIFPCLGATFISGLAGALSQKGLQVVNGGRGNPFLYTVEVSFFSAVCLLLPLVFAGLKNKSKSIGNEDKIAAGYFDYWTRETFFPIFVKAVGGVLTALVHKHAGSVVKGFALILGLVLSGAMQTFIDNEKLRLDQVVGIILVMISSWLHFTNPP
uniref:Sugar phosphate transporter domain-containing protein n=1 Tax=Proboscia inermis TaxID=420281 RepID=A0A7S0GB08_9STRA|mmetsp:Transcript_27981/g.28382  ORF Transcript_27981/g.28382 Transcript_27981/m.28382 type:complete len:453 (+) Transcript_27981:56-1414(+)